jgi:hypothetical protein
MEDILIYTELSRDFQIYEMEITAGEAMILYPHIENKILLNATVIVKADWLHSIQRSVISVYAESGDIIPATAERLHAMTN